MKKCVLVLISAVFVSSMPALAQKWVGTWAASPVPGSPKITDAVLLGSSDLTIRQVIHVSRGGNKLRLSLTNEFGQAPLSISDIHIQQHGVGDAILPSSDHVVKFSGSPSVVIPAGQFVASDPIDMPVPNTSDLTISFCVPKQALQTATLHELSMATSYVSTGDQATAASLTAPTSFQHWYFIKDLQIDSPENSVAVVTLGDSITDGVHSSLDANRRWPDDLAARLLANAGTAHIAVLNEGISGNRVLQEGTGPAAVDRLDRDVLNAPGARYVILMEGINDVGRTFLRLKPGDPVTTDQIIDGYKQIIQRVHAKGMKIYGATLTPYMGAGYSSPQGEQMRLALNAFILHPGNFDGVIDFDKVTRDPEHPDHFLPTYNDGDHLHPNDAGYAAMAGAIDLSLFR